MNMQGIALIILFQPVDSICGLLLFYLFHNILDLVWYQVLLLKSSAFLRPILAEFLVCCGYCFQFISNLWVPGVLLTPKLHQFELSCSKFQTISLQGDIGRLNSSFCLHCCLAIWAFRLSLTVAEYGIHLHSPIQIPTKFFDTFTAYILFVCI